ncbi:BET1 homolog [Hyalella azteca]|uniref:BET1 homolog n=1 Tax=Hyalella azteca TaxID=294128 RepID=A0A8B7PBH8_HYAAZ|nr:BET1 homolog [Hyalella azteca]XP_018023439.1 BET1 homolog [Hyalella azteca]
MSYYNNHNYGSTYGSGRASGAGSMDGNSKLIEDENEDLTTQLRSKVKTLKSMTIDIGNEVRYQNKMLADMDDDMGKSGSILDRTVKRLGVMSRSLHNYHTPILFAFVFFVFLLLWLALKFR